jgi:hypothetical protein
VLFEGVDFRFFVFLFLVLVILRTLLWVEVDVLYVSCNAGQVCSRSFDGIEL